MEPARRPTGRRTGRLTVATCLLLAACGSSADQVTTGSTTTGPADTAVTASSPAAPTTPEATTTTTLAPPAYDPACDDAAAREDDVDGDGRADRVLHTFTDPTSLAVLRVCTADGLVHEVEGAGMAELNDLLDVDGDGVAEIFFGATTAGSVGVRIARFVDGELLTVATDDGEILELTAGAVPGQPFDQVRTGYGCADLGGDARREVVQVRVTLDGTWSQTTDLAAWSLDGAVAVPEPDVFAYVGLPIDAPEDPVERLDLLVTSQAPPC